MLFLRLVKKAIKSKPIHVPRKVDASRLGEKGESQVDARLNPLLFGKVPHRQVNNVTILDENGYSHQIDHVEIRRNGIFCSETKNYSGWIFGSENQKTWTQVLSGGKKYQFVNPLKQNATHVYQLNKVLKGKYKIFSVVVFVQNNADKIDIPNVINLCNLKSYLANFHSGVCYSDFELDMIQAQIMAANKRLTNSEHVQNIEKQQNDFNQNICPRCKSQLVLRQGKFGQFWGCINYPKCKFTKPID